MHFVLSFIMKILVSTSLCQVVAYQVTYYVVAEQVIIRAKSHYSDFVIKFIIKIITRVCLVL